MACPHWCWRCWPGQSPFCWPGSCGATSRRCCWRCGGPPACRMRWLCSRSASGGTPSTARSRFSRCSRRSCCFKPAHQQIDFSSKPAILPYNQSGFLHVFRNACKQTQGLCPKECGLTRLFFATDIHGSEICWKKFLNAGKFYNADVLVLGGDMTGKALVPITQLPDGTFKATLLQQQFILKNEDEVHDMERRGGSRGYYPLPLPPRQPSVFAGQPPPAPAFFPGRNLEMAPPPPSPAPAP